MSDTLGLALFFVGTMMIPVGIIIYIKWDSIKARWEKRKNLSPDDEEQPTKIKLFINTYFGDGSLSRGEVTSIEELSGHSETKSSQQILSEQRKIEKKSREESEIQKQIQEKEDLKKKEKELLAKAKKNNKIEKSEKSSDKKDKEKSKNSTSNKKQTNKNKKETTVDKKEKKSTTKKEEK